MTEKEKMLSQKLYLPWDAQLLAERRACRELLWQIAALPPSDEAGKRALYLRLLGSVSGDFAVEGGLHCDYGYNIHLGAEFYANWGCVMLDCAPIAFGDCVMLAPGVHIYTVSHPLHWEKRREGKEFALPVTIGDDVWIGGNAVINPGVTIGKGSVIGSGSVVTRDIPAGVLAAGIPCRVIREIDEADRHSFSGPAQGSRNRLGEEGKAGKTADGAGQAGLGRRGRSKKSDPARKEDAHG